MHTYRYEDSHSNCIRGVDIPIIFFNASQNVLTSKRKVQIHCNRLEKKEIISIFSLQGSIRNSKDIERELEIKIPYEKTGVAQVD